MIFDYQTFKDVNEVKDKYTLVVNELKRRFKVDLVANFEQLALYSNLKKSGYDWHNFKQISHNFKLSDYIPDIRDNGEVKVLCISFKIIAKYFDPSFAIVSGSNESAPIYHDKGTFFDSKLKIILPFDENDNESLIHRYEYHLQEKAAWFHFNNNVKPKLTTLNERFEIYEIIYDFYLCVMPPIFGKYSFYMSEAVDLTPNGEAIYYKLTKVGEKFFIELSTLKN